MDLFLILAEGGDQHWLLDPHHGLIVWTAVCFALAAIVLYRFAWGPLLTALEAREEAIVGSLEAAEATKREAEAKRQEYEALMEQYRQEAQSIIDEGEADKKRIIQEAHTKASKEAAEIKARADRDIGLAKSKALAELKEDARHLGMAIAEKVIAAEVDAKKHTGIIDEVIASYERG
jgi:F-type H+-transporting ATPase subunit b